MNRFDMIDAMAKKADTTRLSAFLFLNALTDTIKEEIKQERDVRIFGFGTFECRKRKMSDGFDPETKEKRRIPKHNLPGFKPGETFKRIVK